MQLNSAYGIELASFIDLVRLITNSSPERPSTIFKWVTIDSKKVYYGSFAIFPGYYNYKGLPALFFVVFESSIEEENQSLVRYDLQAKENQLSFLSRIDEKDLENVHTGLVRFIPIIKLKKMPKIFETIPEKRNNI